VQGAIATGDGVALCPAAAAGFPLGPGGGGGDDGDDGGEDDDPNRITKIGDLMRSRGKSAPAPAWKRQKRDTQRYLQLLTATPEQAAAEDVMQLIMTVMERTLAGQGRQGAAFPAVLRRQPEVVDITEDPVPIRPTAAKSKSAPPAKAAPPPPTTRLPIPTRPPPPPWKAANGAPAAPPRRPWMTPPPGMPTIRPAALPPPPAMEPTPSFPPPLPTIPPLPFENEWEAWTGRCFFFNNMWLLAIQALPIHEEFLIESGSLVA
jgi:hypothetical protein